MDTPLRQFRRDRKLTLKALADQTGIGPTHLWRLERGEAGVSLANAIKLAEATGLPIEVLAKKAA